MRKMKKLLKARDGLIPWFNWSTIHLILNTISLFVLFIFLYFTGITKLAVTWFIVGMVQYIPIILLLSCSWIIQTLLYKNALAIIKRRLIKCNIKIEATDICVEHFTLHSCTIRTNNNLYPKELKDVIRKANHDFSNRYNVILIEPKTNNVK